MTQGQGQAVKVQSALESSAPHHLNIGEGQQPGEVVVSKQPGDTPSVVLGNDGPGIASGILGANNQQSGFVQLFTARLAAKFEADDVLKSAKARSFLDEIQQLFELLAAMASYPETAEFEEVHMLSIHAEY